MQRRSREAPDLLEWSLTPDQYAVTQFAIAVIRVVVGVASKTCRPTDTSSSCRAAEIEPGKNDDHHACDRRKCKNSFAMCELLEESTWRNKSCFQADDAAMSRLDHMTNEGGCGAANGPIDAFSCNVNLTGYLPWCFTRLTAFVFDLKTFISDLTSSAANTDSHPSTHHIAVSMASQHCSQSLRIPVSALEWLKDTRCLLTSPALVQHVN